MIILIKINKLILKAAILIVCFLSILNTCYSQNDHKKNDEKKAFELCFEGGFNNTSVKVYLNESVIYDKIISTIPSIGLASSINCKSLTHAKIRFELNYKKIKTVRYKGKKYLYVNYAIGMIFIKQSNKVRFYD